MERTSSFLSTSKFVEHINNQASDVISANIYFEGDDMFKNQFKNTCIKPIFIELKCKDDKKKYITYKEIIEQFNGELIISFNESDKRKITKPKGMMFRLFIDFMQKEFNGINYYPSQIISVMNKKNINKIKSQVHKQNYIEEDLPDDVF
ncbi:hypothetical protein M9Y10_039742 [Tritrichomonas musculus]|uniref:Uncharacterized protein n=1 Tax=Tritrichomonas musculus TaxID=1915356 RepID=A0ABR2GR35_9EUKA